jgi:hypothetical protein
MRFAARTQEKLRDTPVKRTKHRFWIPQKQWDDENQVSMDGQSVSNSKATL